MFEALKREHHYTPRRCTDTSISYGGYSITAQIQMLGRTIDGHPCTWQHTMHTSRLSRFYSNTTQTSTRRMTSARHNALYVAIFKFYPEEAIVDVVQRLLELGADANAFDYNHSTPLHQASSEGLLEVARGLLSYGANVDEKDEEGRTSSQVASEKEYHKITKLLLEHGAVAQP